MYNLFGDTDAANVNLTTEGVCSLVSPSYYDTRENLLRYVEFDPSQLLTALPRPDRRGMPSGLEQAGYLRFLASRREVYTHSEEQPP
jgi:arginine decarboxylase-like protein